MHLILAASPRAQGVVELQRGARRQGVSEIMLHVDPSRGGALRLYEAAGFVQDELLRDYYSDKRDALVMKLRMAPPTSTVDPPRRMSAEAGAAALAAVAAVPAAAREAASNAAAIANAVSSVALTGAQPMQQRAPKRKLRRA